MLSGWANMRETSKKSGGDDGGLFVRLKNDGDNVVLAFVGEPYGRKLIWTGSGYEIYDEDYHGKPERGPTVKWMVNVYVPETNSIKIYEFGKSVASQISAVTEDNPPDKWLFKVRRNGAAGDKKTTYIVSPISMIDDATRANILASDPVDLEALDDARLAREIENRTSPKDFGSDDIPF